MVVRKVPGKVEREVARNGRMKKQVIRLAMVSEV